jgi:hypothetical protein
MQVQQYNDYASTDNLLSDIFVAAAAAAAAAGSP